MFSKTCEYAIKSLIFVAQKTKQNVKVAVEEIAIETSAPKHFVAKILQDLKRKNLVLSIKGPNGGFYMDQRCLNLSIAAIVKAVDGEGIYLDCIIGLKSCSEKNPCPLHFEYKEIKKNLLKMLEKNTIGEFNETLNSGKYFLKC
jgi:Rrf2 family protein